MVTSVTKSFSAETATAKASVPTRNSMGFAAEGGTGFDFAVFDGTGGVGDVGFAGITEAFKTSTGTDGVDGDLPPPSPS